MLRPQEHVEELHGGDGNVVAVAVHATQKNLEENRLATALSAEKTHHQIDEGRRGRGEKEREKESCDASAGDDALVATFIKQSKTNRIFSNSTSIYPRKTVSRMDSRMAS